MKIHHLIVIVVLTAATDAAVAGRSCEPRVETAAQLSKSLDLAAKTRDALEQTGARVALVARVGRDLSKHGLRFSHFGVAWRDHPDGRWSVVHKLNECESARADLYAEGLANFFSDGMFAYEAWVLVPRDAVQDRLANALARDSGASFHGSAYSLVSYPFSTRYQNSNAWALELLAGALSAEPSVTDRATAQAWLKANGYEPTRFSVGPLTRLAGRLFRANVAFDDHPSGLRWSNRIDTVTVESAFAFALRQDAVKHSFLVGL